MSCSPLSDEAPFPYHLSTPREEKKIKKQQNKAQGDELLDKSCQADSVKINTEAVFHPHKHLGFDARIKSCILKSFMLLQKPRKKSLISKSFAYTKDFTLSVKKRQITEESCISIPLSSLAMCNRIVVSTWFS